MNRCEKVFVIKKVINPAPWVYVINNINGEEIVGTFYKKRIAKKKKKKNQKELRIEKVIKRKGNRLYVKTKGYNNLFKG